MTNNLINDSVVNCWKQKQNCRRRNQLWFVYKCSS